MSRGVIADISYLVCICVLMYQLYGWCTCVPMSCVQLYELYKLYGLYDLCECMRL